MLGLFIDDCLPLFVIFVSHFLINNRNSEINTGNFIFLKKYKAQQTTSDSDKCCSI